MTPPPLGHRKPITRQRSPWQPTERMTIADVDVAAFRRAVSDGTLRALLAEEPLGWHLSVSFVNHRGMPTRYPTWDELAHARDALLPADIGFVMHLPRADQYVAVHPTTFHLHEHPERHPA